MLILVDSNEEATNPKTVALMRKHFPNMQVTSLSAGDVNVILEDGEVLAIERKAAGDFLASIGDGRLFKQVEQMANGMKFYCVIVVGNITYDPVTDMALVDGEETNWKGASVRGAMYALQWSACPIVYTSYSMYPFTIMEVIHLVSQPTQHLQRLNHNRIITFPPVELSVEILASFPGIGLKRAQALMDYVDNTPYKRLAGALAWASVFGMIKRGGRPEGWGDKTVLNFRTMLGLNEGEYLEIRKESKHAQESKKK